MDHLRLENRHTGEILRMRRIRNASGEMTLTLEGSLPAGGDGPPEHIHPFEVERGTVRRGTLGAKVGGKTITVAAGASAEFPKGVPHAWWNAGNTTLEFEGEATPVIDLDRYLQAVFEVMNAGPAGRPPLFYLAHVMWRHRHTQQVVTPPLAVQRFLFPVVIFVGRLLGKYRGDGWPGSPAACKGAPVVESASARTA